MRFKINGSWVAAIVITAAIAGWMSTGDVVVGGQADSPNAVPPPAERTAEKEAEPFRVQVSTLTAEDRRTSLKIRGRTEAEARPNGSSRPATRCRPATSSASSTAAPARRSC